MHGVLAAIMSGMLILLILDAQQVHTESGQRLAPRVPNDALRSFTSKVVETGFEPKALGRKLDRYLEASEEY